MFRFLRLLVLALLAVVLVTLALANRDLVTLRLLPPDTGAFLGLRQSFDVPLFLVILAGVLAGLLVGFVWEWLRESGLRAQAAQDRRRAERLEREVARARPAAAAPRDEVLALLDERSV